MGTKRSVIRLAVLGLVGSLGLVVLVGAGVAAAERPGHRSSPGSFVARHAQRLGLDAEAQERIRELVERSGERDAALREQRETARKALRKLMTETHRPDESSVMQQADAIARTEAEIHKNRLGAILAIREELSPEQRAELLRMRDEEHPHHRGRGRSSRACRREVEQMCGEPGDPRGALECLLTNWKDVTPKCREHFEFSKHHRHRHRHRDRATP